MDNDVVIGNIVLKVHEDLNRLQEKLKLKENQDSIDVADIKELISNTQNGLQKRAEELLNQLNNRVISSSSAAAENSGQKGKISAVLAVNHRANRLQDFLPTDIKSMELSAGNAHSSPGDNLKREIAWRSVANPHNKLNRIVANDKFGIQLPLIHDKMTAKNPNFEAIQKGSMVKKLEKLPLETNKHFNNVKPAKIAEIDARKGLLNLIERGLIPPNAKITFDPPPINNETIPILSASTRNRVYIPAGTNDHGYSIACYHMDQTNDMDEDYLDEDKVDMTYNLLVKGNYSSKDKDDTGLPNVLSSLPNSKEPHENPKRSTIRRKGQDRLSNCKSVQNIEFKGNVGEKEKVDQDENSATKITPPPPTTPALQIPKSKIDSCHKFLIKYGTIIDDHEDFIQFKRHYCLVWGGIISITKALEKLLKEYSIPLALINGDRVADLSVEYELEIKPSEQELLSCVMNRNDVLELFRQPGRRFMGENGRAMAALVIQCKWRAYLARKIYLDYRRKRWAAGVIAIQWMLHMKMSQVKEVLNNTRLNQLRNFRKRYQTLSSNWTKIQSTRRIVIHIPSIGLDEKQRLKIRKLPELQNHQMTRLCDIKNDNIDVIYISPVQMNEEILQYFSKLLALKSAIDSGNSTDQKPINSRYKIIIPEAIKSFPNHNMCLSSILRYSPQALSRIKNMIKGRSSWIVPGVVHVDDLAIADELDVPILGTEPEILDKYRTKSGIRKIFEKAKVDKPPGDSGIVSLNQLHESLAQLITDNLNIKRWIFKTNFDIKSRGISYIDVDTYLTCYVWAQKERKRYGEKWNNRWAQENAYNRILREIPDIIEKHLVLIDGKSYPSKSKFWKEFFTRGGVVEGFPSSDSVTNITVNIFIDPIGDIHITGSGDQIHDDNPLNAWGYSVPQSSIDSEVLNTACLKIAESCRNADIRGYLSIDFVTFIENNEDNQSLWAIDIDFQYSDLASLMNLSIFTTNAKFKWDEHLFLVDSKLDSQSSQPTPMNRYVCLSTQLSHTNLSMVHYSVFFQMCRAHGIGFDLKEKQGTIFSLIDSFNRENLSMITIGTTLESTLESFGKNLYILHQEISSPNMVGHGNFQVVIKEIENILGLAIENHLVSEAKSEEGK